MFENFLKIDITKQKRVLAAALEVFSREGYLRANTNEIAALAEISKGLLFHYFGSKKNLYLFLLDETVKQMSERLMHINLPIQAELFELLRVVSVEKLRIAVEDPKGYRLIYEAFMHTPKGLEEDIKARFSGLFSNSAAQISALVDESLFKPTVGKTRAIKILMAYMRGVFEEYNEQNNALTPEEAVGFVEDYSKQLFEDFEVFREAFYK